MLVVMVMLIMLLLLQVLLIRWPRIATILLVLWLLTLLVVVPCRGTTIAGSVQKTCATSFLVRCYDRGCGRRIRKVVLMVVLLLGRMVLWTVLLLLRLRRLMILQGVREGGRRRGRSARPRIVVHPGTVRRGHYRRRVRLTPPGTIGMVLLVLFGFAATCYRSCRNATARLLLRGV